MEEITVSSRGQIVIPKHIRKELGIKNGNKLLVSAAGKEIKLIPKPSDPVKALIKLGEDLKLGDMRKEIKEARKETKRDALSR